MENPYQTPATIAAAEEPSVAGLKRLRPLALWSVGLYGISVASEIGEFFARGYWQQHHQPIHEEFDSMASGPGPFEWVMLAAGLSSALLYLFWKYRAAANARLLDPAAMTISPAMAVGSYFIPFVFFVVPYRAMAGIARASLGSAAGVGLWWTAQVGSVIFGGVVGWSASGELDPVTGFPLRPSMLEHLYLVASVITFLISAWLVMRITRAQEEQRER